jgi:hypothetical protein
MSAWSGGVAWCSCGVIFGHHFGITLVSPKTHLENVEFSAADFVFALDGQHAGLHVVQLRHQAAVGHRREQARGVIGIAVNHQHRVKVWRPVVVALAAFSCTFHARHHLDHFRCMLAHRQHQARSLVDDVEDFQRVGDSREDALVAMHKQLLECAGDLEQQQVLVDLDEVPRETVQADDAGETLGLEQVREDKVEIWHDNHVELLDGFDLGRRAV